MPTGRRSSRVFTKGFVYSDGWVDDARLVVLNAIDAAERGATVLHAHALQRGAARHRRRWTVRLEARDGASVDGARARARQCGRPVGGAVPARRAPASAGGKTLRLVKGSHIVVRRLFEHDHAYIFQNPDGRIIFAIPYEGEFTLIGTTDVEHTGRSARRTSTPPRPPTCASRRAAISPAPCSRPTWCGAIRACARCSTTNRAPPRP